MRISMGRGTSSNGGCARVYRSLELCKLIPLTPTLSLRERGSNEN